MPNSTAAMTLGLAVEVCLVTVTFRTPFIGVLGVVRCTEGSQAANPAEHMDASSKSTTLDIRNYLTHVEM